MHIAIGIWGIVRSLKYTVKSIQEYCLDPIVNAGHTYEIYIHTYKFSGVYTNGRSNEISLQLNFTEWQLLNPDHIYVEDQDVFDANTNFTSYHTHGDPWHNNYVSFTNHLRALNSLFYLASKIELESQVKHFDGVVYLRPDVTYLNELPVYLLEHIPNTLFLPDFHRSCHGGEYNDRMAMGDVQSAIAYGKRFEDALEYSQHKRLHSETFTYDYLTEHEIAVKEIPFRFRRTRADGQFHVRDRTAIVAPRHQHPHQAYTTSIALRVVYTFLEEVTYHKVYIWNHDDHENLYCKPHPYLSLHECMAYRKKSKKIRMQRLKLVTNPEEAEANDEYTNMELSSDNEDNVAVQEPESKGMSIVDIAQTVHDKWLDSFASHSVVKQQQVAQPASVIKHVHNNEKKYSWQWKNEEMRVSPAGRRERANAAESGMRDAVVTATVGSIAARQGQHGGRDEGQHRHNKPAHDESLLLLNHHRSRSRDPPITAGTITSSTSSRNSDNKLTSIDAPDKSSPSWRSRHVGSSQEALVQSTRKRQRKTSLRGVV